VVATVELAINHIDKRIMNFLEKFTDENIDVPCLARRFLIFFAILCQIR
jgi:hypothetical protein